MKQLLLTAIGVLGLALGAIAQTSSLTFSVSFTGTPNEYDVDAATLVVQKHNDQITAANANLPPEDQTALWPLATPAELKASYLAIWAEQILNAHKSYAVQAAKIKLETEFKEALLNATDAAREQALQLLQSNPKP